MREWNQQHSDTDTEWRENQTITAAQQYNGYKVSHVGIQRSQVWLADVPLSHNNSVHSHVLLSQSNITWCWPKGGSALCSWESTSSLTMHDRLTQGR